MIVRRQTCAGPGGTALRVFLALVAAGLSAGCGEGPIARLLDIDPPFEFATGVAADSTGTGAIVAGSTTPDGSYRDGTTVSAEARADDGSEFLAWVDGAAGAAPGDDVSAENPCSMVLSADLTLHARFGDVDPPYELVVELATGGNGYGSVEQSLPDGSYPAGTALTLEASPALGSEFSGWFDAPCGGALITQDNPAMLELDADVRVFAGFDLITIVFVSDRDGALGQSTSREIYTVLSDGTGLTRLTTNTLEDKYPDWNSDKSRIVLARGDAEGDPVVNFELITCNAGGGGEQQLTSQTGDLHQFQPDWSPDGSRIAYTRWFTSIWLNQIWLMDSDGTDAEEITDRTANEAVPCWSPDGSTIAFMSTRGTGSDFDIWVMENDGSDLQALTSDSSHDDRNPVWSPDGATIVFQSVRDGNKQIYVMNADGSDPVNLSNTTTDDDWPVWSADGKQVIFQRTENDMTAIYMMWADGSGQIKVTDNEGNDYLPDW